MIWYFLSFALIAFVYFGVLVAIAVECHRQNPNWNMMRLWHFTKTFWAWPVIAIRLFIHIAWYLLKNHREIKAIRKQHGLDK